MSPCMNRRSLIKNAAIGTSALAFGGAMSSSALAASSQNNFVLVSNFKANTVSDGDNEVSLAISNKTPTFLSDGGVDFYLSGSAIKVSTLILGIILSSKNVVFDYAYLSDDSKNWSLPDGYSKKAKLSDGTSGYLYEFPYIGQALSGSELVSSPDYGFQVVSGGEKLLGTSFGAQIESIVNGKHQNRTSTTAIIGRNTYSANVVIGDNGVL